MYKTIKALVLREVKYRDADKILTVLTERGGKLTVKARGALRKGCKFAAAAQALCFSEMTLFGNAGRWSLNEAETIEQFLPLRDDLGRLALGSYFAELLEAVSDADSPESGLLQLGLNSLYALSRSLCPDLQVKAAFELRLMCLSGFRPELDTERGEGEGLLFSLSGGCVHCIGDPPEAAGVSLPLSKPVLQAMRYVVTAEPKKLFSFTLQDAELLLFAKVCEAYTATQLERSFRALDYWKCVAPCAKDL